MIIIRLMGAAGAGKDTTADILAEHILFLQDLQDGRTHAEITAKLSELIEAVRATGRGGEIVLAIKVKPATRGDVDKVTITDDVRLKLQARRA